MTASYPRASLKVKEVLAVLTTPAYQLLSRFRDEGGEALEEVDLAHALNPLKQDEDGTVLPTPPEVRELARAAIAELHLLGCIIQLEMRIASRRLSADGHYEVEVKLGPSGQWTRTALGESVSRAIPKDVWR